MGLFGKKKIASGVDTTANAAATPDKVQPYAALGLKDDEYNRIREILGRRPYNRRKVNYKGRWNRVDWPIS